MVQKIKKIRIWKRRYPGATPMKRKFGETSFLTLKKMAKTKEQEDVLKRIEHETIPMVRDAWIEYFFELTQRTKENVH